MTKDQDENVLYAFSGHTEVSSHVKDLQDIDKEGGSDRGSGDEGVSQNLNASMEIYGNQLFEGSAQELHQKATKIQSAYRGYAVRKSMGDGKGLGRMSETPVARLQGPYFSHGHSDGQCTDDTEDEESYHSATGEGLLLLVQRLVTIWGALCYRAVSFNMLTISINHAAYIDCSFHFLHEFPFHFHCRQSCTGYTMHCRFGCRVLHNLSAGKGGHILFQENQELEM